MKENQITLVSDDGEEQLATILFTHEANEENYVVFELAETGDISAAKYIEGENGEGELIEFGNYRVTAYYYLTDEDEDNIDYFDWEKEAEFQIEEIL